MLDNSLINICMIGIQRVSYFVNKYFEPETKVETFGKTTPIPKAISPRSLSNFLSNDWLSESSYKHSVLESHTCKQLT